MKRIKPKNKHQIEEPMVDIPTQEATTSISAPEQTKDTNVMSIE